MNATKSFCSAAWVCDRILRKPAVDRLFEVLHLYGEMINPPLEILLISALRRRASRLHGCAVAVVADDRAQFEFEPFEGRE